jgi:hypothetical protein
MQEIEKFISPFIESQFPSFYQEEGEVFIDFVKAYYEWMERYNTVTGEKGILRDSRSLLEYRDVDDTLQQFVIHFKNKYINSLPENVVADKQLLMKHILDLYRSKGTERSYNLLFKMLFNEDIEVYVPSKEIFKLSDGDWVVPRYIEVSDSPYLTDMIGKEIYSSSSFSTAVVENYFTKNVNKKIINVLELTNLQGNFKYGEKVLCDSIDAITPYNAPEVFGSLSSVSITDGGLGFEVGDILQITESGVGGLARVKAVRRKNGEVTFSLIDGGTGFSMNAVINVDGKAISMSNASNTNPVRVTTSVAHGISSGQTLRIDYVEGMEQLNINAYSYYANVVNTTAFDLYSNPTLTTTIDGVSFTPYETNTGYVYINTGGAGATFEIGSLVNKEIYKINTDDIEDYLNAVLDSTVSGYTLQVNNVQGTFTVNDAVKMNDVAVRDFDCDILTDTIMTAGENLSNVTLGISALTVVRTDDSYLILRGADINNSNLVYGAVLVSNTTSTTLKINNALPAYTVNCTANVIAVNSTHVSVNNQNGYFLPNQMLYDTTSSANANIVSVKRLTHWDFPAAAVPDIENLDTTIINALTTEDLEVGTIASLKNINPGEGYAIDPVVSIIEPLIYKLRYTEPDGSFKGFNATVLADAGYANGIVTAVEVIDSGFGYDRNTKVQLYSPNSQYSVAGVTVIDINGISEGYWKDNKSFISDKMFLQDSDYYQNYSYEIIASRMLYTYENYVKNLVHPAGMKLFGRFVIKNELVSESSLQFSGISLSISVTSDTSLFSSDTIRITADNFDPTYITSDSITIFSDTIGITADQVNLQ